MDAWLYLRTGFKLTVFHYKSYICNELQSNMREYKLDTCISLCIGSCIKQFQVRFTQHLGIQTSQLTYILAYSALLTTCPQLCQSGDLSRLSHKIIIFLIENCFVNTVVLGYFNEVCSYTAQILAKLWFSFKYFLLSCLTKVNHDALYGSFVLLVQCIICD